MSRNNVVHVHELSHECTTYMFATSKFKKVIHYTYLGYWFGGCGFK